MSKFERNPGRGRRVMATIIAIVGTCSLFSHRESSRVIAAAMLLTAWEMAFLSSLPLNLTVAEIYQRTRRGWRMSLASRVITVATLVLLGFGTYLQFHGR